MNIPWSLQGVQITEVPLYDDHFHIIIDSHMLKGNTITKGRGGCYHCHCPEEPNTLRKLFNILSSASFCVMDFLLSSSDLQWQVGK